MKKSLIGLALACAALGASADAPRVRLFASAGYGFGGDPLLEGTWVDSNGQQTGTWDLKAGKGTTLALGADLRVTDRLSLQASMGYQRESIDGVGSNFVFSRVPVELLGFYSLTDRLRLGLGVRKTQSAKIQGGGTYDYINEPYEASGGAVIEGQYLFGTPSRTERAPTLGVYLRFVNETYKARRTAWDAEKRSGDQLALGLLFYY